MYVSPPGSTMKSNYYNAPPPGVLIPWPANPQHSNFLSLPSLALGHSTPRRSIPSSNGGPVYSGVPPRHYRRNTPHDAMRRTLTKYTKF